MIGSFIGIETIMVLIAGLYISNVVQILVNAARCGNGKQVKYYPSINILK